MFAKIWTDFWGLRAVCGFRFALRWLFAIFVTLPACIKTRNLGPADQRIVRRRLPVRFDKIRVTFGDNAVIASVREIWARNIYGIESLPTGGTVIDLGANVGVFTAAAAGSGNRVIAVEASRVGCKNIESLCALNGWNGNSSCRVDICNSFVGGDTPAQHDATQIPDHDGVPFITVNELLARYNVGHVDFLKCDIEGSEYGLIRDGGGRLFEITDRLAMEVHYWAGTREEMVALLERKGFAVTIHQQDPNGCILRAQKRRGAINRSG